MLCDRLNCAAFYLCFAALQHEMILPVAVYLFEFLVIDFFLSLAFLAWPIRSPNYFYEVDERIYRWNWSKPAKAVNSSLFAVLLLVTGWWWLGLVIALGLVVLKCVSLRWLLQLGLPVPERRGRQPRRLARRRGPPLADHVRAQHRLGAAPVPADGGRSSSAARPPSPGSPAAISLGIAAGAGATVGKVVWYELARRGLELAVGAEEARPRPRSRPATSAGPPGWRAVRSTPAPSCSSPPRSGSRRCW